MPTHRSKADTAQAVDDLVSSLNHPATQEIQAPRHPICELGPCVPVAAGHRARGPQASLSEAFVVDDTATPERLAQAVDLLDRCTGIVMLGPVIVLRPSSREIRCEVVDPMPAAHRCEEEYKVLVENAARALVRSKLGALLPDRSLRWAVVEKRDGVMVEAWSG